MHKDHVNQVVCGGIIHTTNQHGDFHEIMVANGGGSYWPTAIKQKSFDEESKRYVCMKVSRRYQQGSCMLLDHKDTDDPNLPPSHYTWADLKDDVEEGNLDEEGTEKRWLQDAYILGESNVEAVIDLEHFKQASQDEAPEWHSGGVRLRAKAKNRARAPTPVAPRSGGNRDMEEDEDLVVVKAHPKNKNQYFTEDAWIKFDTNKGRKLWNECELTRRVPAHSIDDEGLAIIADVIMPESLRGRTDRFT